MKKLFLLTILVFLTTAPAEAQDNGGRILEMIVRGIAHAVTSENGLVDQILVSLAISAKPADIPTEIAVDISGLTVGDAIRVSDLPLPAGVTTDVDGDDPVITASAGSQVEPAASGEGGDAAGAEGGEAAEGDGGEG